VPTIGDFATERGRDSHDACERRVATSTFNSTENLLADERSARQLHLRSTDREAAIAHATAKGLER